MLTRNRVKADLQTVIACAVREYLRSTRGASTGLEMYIELPVESWEICLLKPEMDTITISMT